MTEVDFWIKVLEKLDFSFEEEFCGVYDINKIYYKKSNQRAIISFNRKNEEILYFTIKNSNGNGDIIYTYNSFSDTYKDYFREVKILYLTGN